MSIEISDDRAKIADFLMSNHLGVVSTASPSGVPHAAVIHFVNDADLNLYFITKENTEKDKNLQHNPNVAMAVYDARTQTTLQITGKAAVDKDPQKFMNVFTQILKISMDMSEGATPPVSKLKNGEYRLYVLRPDKIRIAEYTKPERGDLDDIFGIINF